METTRPFRYGLNKILYNYTGEVTNRFKGLDLIEVWMKVHDIIKETVIKTIPKKKKCKKAKQLSEKVLEKAEKIREVKGKGEKEIYIHLNAEFQRYQGEIGKPSSVINAKKQRKTIEWERLNWDFFGKNDAKAETPVLWPLHAKS